MMSKFIIIFLLLQLPWISYSQWEVKEESASTSFFAVDIHESGVCYAVGYPFMKSEDNGETWSEVEFPGLDSLYFDFLVLNDVKILSATTTIAVGWHILDNNNVIIRSDDSGETWDVVYAGALANGIEFKAVSFLDALKGVAVGENGSIFRTSNGGLTWFSSPSGTLEILRDVTFLSSTQVMAVGTNTILTSSNSGLSWTVQSHPNKRFYSVKYSTPSNKITATYLLTPGSESHLFTSTNLGLTWTSRNIDLGTVKCHEILENDSIYFGFDEQIYLGLTEDCYMYRFTDPEMEEVSDIKFGDGYGLAVTHLFDESKIFKFNYGDPWELEQIVSFSFPDSICAGELIHYTVNNPTLESYEWLVNGVSVSTDTNLDYAHPTAGTISVQLITEFEGNIDTIARTVAVIGDPTLSPIIIVSDSVICFGSEYGFNLLNIANATGFNVLVNGEEVLFSSASGSNRYYDLGEVDDDLNIEIIKWAINECDSIAVTEEFFLQVENYPDSLNHFYAIDTLVCHGNSTMVIIPSPEINISYTVFQDAISLGTETSMVGEPLSFSTLPVYTSDIITITATSVHGCVVSMETTELISVDPVNAEFDLGVSYFYTDSLISFSTDGMVGEYFNWSVSGTPAVFENSDLIHPDLIYSSPGSYDLKVVVESAFAGCKDSLNDSLFVFETPNDTTDKTICSITDNGKIDVLDQTIDRFGNLILVGYKGVIGTSGNIIPAGVIQKFDSEGNLLWDYVQDFGTYSYHRSVIYSSVTTDQFGNIYLTGSVDIDRFVFRYWELYVETGTSYDRKKTFILKINGDGDFIWINHVPAQDATEGFSDILYDENTNNLFVCGSLKFGDLFSSIHGYQNINGDQLKVLRFDQTGLLLAIHEATGNPVGMQPGRHDPIGVVAVGATFCFNRPTMEMGEDSLIYLFGPSSGYMNFNDDVVIYGEDPGKSYVAVLQPYGADSGWVSAHRFPETSISSYIRGTVDSDKNIYICSGFEFFGTSGIYKFDSDYNLIWYRKFDRLNIKDMILVNDNELYFIGNSRDYYSVYNDDSPLNLTYFEDSMATQTIIGIISTDGDLEWQDVIGSYNSDEVHRLKSNSCGEIYMTGKSLATHYIDWEVGVYNADKDLAIEINNIVFETISGSYFIKMTDTTCLIGGCGTLCDDPDLFPDPIIYDDGANLSTDEFEEYQWYRDGVLLVGEVAQSIVATEPGEYKVIVFDLNGCAGESDTHTITCESGDFFPEPTITDLGTILTTEVYLSYQWYQDGVELPDETNQTLFYTEPGMYMVGVTNEFECYSLSDEFEITDPISDLNLSDINLTSLSIYPNPSSNEVNINYSLTSNSDITIEIKDASGKLVYFNYAPSMDSGTHERMINVTNFSSGLYFITIKVNSEIYINKLVVR